MKSENINEETFVSFIIPSRNEEGYIANCINSIKEQKLNNPYEVIVVDNMSTDKTVMIAENLGANTVKEEKLGLAYVRARGLAIAQGDIIFFVDADTILPPKWALKIINYFAKHKDVVGISCGFKFYDGKLHENIGRFFIQLPNPFFNYILQCLNKPHLFFGQSFALRKSALLRAGGIDMNFPFYTEDLAIARRLYTQGKVRYIPSLTVKTSARRYHRLGSLKTLYLYLIPLLFMNLGMYERAKRFSARHLNQT
jgi:glycosyltransferase involved in cell wall biosynthesis